MKDNIVKIYVGYDPVENVAWHTFVESVIRHSSVPVAFVPVNIRNFKSFYDRSRDPKQSNEFSFSRFLVPYLNDFNGYALFFDCDMLNRVDIASIFDVAHSQPDKAVYVVKHTYLPRDDIKYLDTVQYAYPRKNWSSVVLWNCSHPSNRVVTPEFVQSSSGLDLHRFSWLDDSEIGELDVRWNWLVGEYIDPPKNVFNVHWTLGGPYFREYADVDFSDEWKEMFDNVIYCKQRS